MSLALFRRSVLSVRGVSVLLAALIGLVVATHAGELKRRAAYRWNGSIEVEGVTLVLPPDDPFLEYLLDHGTRDTEATLTAQVRRALRPGDTFIDVGANIGWFTLIAARAVGEKGHVIAFEPEPRNFAILKRNVEVNGFKNVTLEQKALSNETGKLKLFLSGTNENHSIAVLGDQRGTIEVDAVRLDDYLKPLGETVRCIKIDTEGAEGVILEGMHETLGRDGLTSLFIEFDPFLLEAAGARPAKVLETLRASGFAIHRIDEDGQRIVPVDAGGLAALAVAKKGGNLFLSRVARPAAADPAITPGPENSMSRELVEQASVSLIPLDPDLSPEPNR